MNVTLGRVITKHTPPLNLPEEIRKQDCRAVDPTHPSPNCQIVVSKDSVYRHRCSEDEMIDLEHKPKNQVVKALYSNDLRENELGIEIVGVVRRGYPPVVVRSS